ncbi:serine-rich adhesin for platelets-like [Haliotis asinina]|uniref:serine-rich adhesin for platelets-like n=1 Tax=Haliotis asinina TaxID=109174 RepID=UPI0035322AF2
MKLSTRVFVCLYIVYGYGGIEARSTSQLPTGGTQDPTSQEPLVGSSVTTEQSVTSESPTANGSSTMTGSPTANGSSTMTESLTANGSSAMTESPTANGSSAMTDSPTGNGSSTMTESPTANRSSAVTESLTANGSSAMTESPTGNGSSAMTESPTGNGSSAMTGSPTANGSSAMTESPTANGSSGMTVSPPTNGSSAMTGSPTSPGSSVTTESFVTSNSAMSSDYTGTSAISSDSSSPVTSDRSPQPTSTSLIPTTQAQPPSIATSTSPMPVPESSSTTAGVTPGPADTSFFSIVVSVAIIGGVLAFLTLATICIYLCVLQPRKKKSASLEESATKKKKKKRKRTSLKESDVSELIDAIDKRSKPLEMDKFDNNGSDGDMENVQVQKENSEMQNGVDHRSDPKAGGADQTSKMESNDANNLRISIHRELLQMTKLRSSSQDSGETNRQMSTFGKAGGLDRSASTVSSISLKGITDFGRQGQGIKDNPEDKAGGRLQEVDGDTTKELVRQDAISSDLSAENAVPASGLSETELKGDSQKERGGTKQLVRQNSFTEDSVSEGGRSESETKINGDTNDKKSISSTEDDKPEEGYSESEMLSDSQQGEGQNMQLASQTANDLVSGTEDSVTEPDPEMQPVNNAGSEHVPQTDNSGTKNEGFRQSKYLEESYNQAYECEAYEEDDVESGDENGQVADGGMEVDPDDGHALGQRHMDIDAMIQQRVGDGRSNIIMSTHL